MTKAKSTEMTVSQAASVAATTGYVAPAFKVKQVLTLPHLKMAEGEPILVTILSMPYEGEEIENDVYEGRPTMIRVRDVTDGVEKELMLKKVLESEFTKKLGNGKDFPDIQGRSFAIVDCGIAEGKRYRTYGVSEIELED